VVHYRDNATMLEYALAVLAAHEATAGVHVGAAGGVPTALTGPITAALKAEADALMRQPQPARPAAAVLVDAATEVLAPLARNESTAMLSLLQRHLQHVHLATTSRLAAASAALQALQRDGAAALARRWNARSQELLASNRGAQESADWRDTLLPAMAELAVLHDMVAEHMQP
jgi:hypothetical protein